MQQDIDDDRCDDDASPDSEDRIQDFLARHGGAGSTKRREQRNASGDGGWYEIYAADGCRLRCEWSRVGNRAEFKFSEVAARTDMGGHG